MQGSCGSKARLGTMRAERPAYSRKQTFALCASEVSDVPMDEIATAIARCAGCLADSVVAAESIDSGEGRAIHCGGSSQIFFDR